MVTSKVKRVTAGTLDGSFGPDRNKRLVVTFIPGDGEKKPDLIEIKPIRARGFRAERIAVIDAYRYAMRCRVNLKLLEKAREKKSRKAERLAALRLKRAENKLRRTIIEREGHYP